MSGDDVYWLGRGTGADEIQEYHDNAVGDMGDKIRVKWEGAGADVRLRRVGENGVDLLVELGGGSDSLTVKDYYKVGKESAKIEWIEFLDEEGQVTESWNQNDIADKVLIKGSTGVDTLVGTDGADQYDSDAGGNDILRGGAGGDLYALGRGTGADEIQEYSDNDSGSGTDKIQVKEYVAVSQVHLRRVGENGVDLLVELAGSDGQKDSLTVKDYYRNEVSKIEEIEFLADSTSWGRRDIAGEVLIKGGTGVDTLVGTDGADQYDSDAGGNDILRGGDGGDVYALGRGTGADEIQEYSDNDSGSGTDKIQVKADVAVSQVHLSRVGENGMDLLVELVGGSDTEKDSLTVKDYYRNEVSKIEEIEFLADNTSWGRRDIAGEVVIKGSDGADILTGSSEADRYDSDAGGDDILRGGGGNDEYGLGDGAGADRVEEYHDNSEGDDNDRIKIESGIGESGVSLTRVGGNGTDLLVELTGANAGNSLLVENYFSDRTARIEAIEFTDGGAIWNEAVIGRKSAIRGERDGDTRVGSQWADVFDGEGSGNNTFQGLGGNDVYWLGGDTDHDTIQESGGEDRIRVEAGIATGNVKLSRVGENGKDLRVELVDANNVVTDSLTVKNGYQEGNEAVKIEFIEFMNEAGEVTTSWDKNKIAEFVVIRGSAGDDEDLRGTPGNDKFDSDEGGDDTLLGGGGNDLYILGKDTGHDTIQEEAAIGDMADVIRIEKGIREENVRVSVSGNDLIVAIIDGDGEATASLKVKGFYAENGRGKRIERVEFFDDEELKELKSEAALDALKGGGG